MKLLRYGDKGQEKPGLLDAQGNIRDLSAHIADVAGTALSAASLAELGKIDPASLPLVSGSPRIGACVGQVGKFICIGLNYADHAAESGLAVPSEPVVFSKWTSAICGPNDNVEIPAHRRQEQSVQNYPRTTMAVLATLAIILFGKSLAAFFLVRLFGHDICDHFALAAGRGLEWWGA